MLGRACVALASIAILSSAAIAASDGFPDPSFGQNGLQVVDSDLIPIQNFRAAGSTILPDGHIVLAGGVFHAGQWGIGLARLTPNGDVDGGFGQPFHVSGDGNSPTIVASLVAQPDGKLVVAATSSATQRGLVCRFRPDGALDTTFAMAQPNSSAPGCRALGGEGVAQLTALALQRDGRILVAGATGDEGSDTSRALAMRLDANGNHDNSFNGNGSVVLLPQVTASTWLTDVVESPDGTIYAVGNAQFNDNANWLVFRLRADGTPDDLWNGNGMKPIAIDHVADGRDEVRAVSVLPDGSIVIAGQAEGANGNCPVVARILPNGSFDHELDGDGLFVGDDACLPDLFISDMLVQSDGRIVLAGEWSEQFFATRILPQGGFDNSFGSFSASWFDFGPAYGVDQTESRAYNIASQAGRLVLSGLATPGDSADFAVARLDNDLIYADNLE